MIISVIGLVPLATLNAQVGESQPPQGELSGDILEPFAGAYKEISQIHTTYTERIMQSNDPAQADALQQEANQKMTQAVADHGLTIKNYNTIFKSIQYDPALKEQFSTVLNRTPSKG
jgi:GTP1/Obg family GTP-binding protein